MQKHKKRKTCKKSNKIKKITFAPAISTSYLFNFKYHAFKSGSNIQRVLDNEVQTLSFKEYKKCF